MRVIGYRPQRTLAAPVELPGVGFITGTRVRVRFLPAPANAGIVFRRIDLSDSPAVPALANQVADTDRRVTLSSVLGGAGFQPVLPDSHRLEAGATPKGKPAGSRSNPEVSPASITLVEHLLAALAGLRIDNCTVELDGMEPPGLDGSAGGFVELLGRTGIVSLPAARPIWTVDRSVLVESHGATLALHPADGSKLRISYLLDYGLTSSIGRQIYTLDATPENFTTEVARCRTFVTEAEAKALKAKGIAPHLSESEVLVFGPRGPIGNRLRFADEPARHKVLDLLGDLSLCGFDLAGHVVGYRSGHALNAELARRLVAAAQRTRAAA